MMQVLNMKMVFQFDIFAEAFIDAIFKEGSINFIHRVGHPDKIERNVAQHI